MLYGSWYAKDAIRLRLSSTEKLSWEVKSLGAILGAIM